MRLGLSPLICDGSSQQLKGRLGDGRAQDRRRLAAEAVRRGLRAAQGKKKQGAVACFFWGGASAKQHHTHIKQTTQAKAAAAGGDADSAAPSQSLQDVRYVPERVPFLFLFYDHPFRAQQAALLPWPFATLADVSTDQQDDSPEWQALQRQRVRPLFGLAASCLLIHAAQVEAAGEEAVATAAKAAADYAAPLLAASCAPDGLPSSKKVPVPYRTGGGGGGGGFMAARQLKLRAHLLVCFSRSSTWLSWSGPVRQSWKAA